MTRLVMVLALWVSLVGPAFPCTVVTGLTTPSDLVQQAEVIVRARAEALFPEPGRQGTMAASPTQVEFSITSLLKGSLPTSRLAFNGVLVAGDERNPGAVPYVVARHSADASCFSLAYRQGAEYLLFLKRARHPAYAQGEQLTPYWAPLAPANEQVFGIEDDWERWVREQLRSSPASKPGA